MERALLAGLDDPEFWRLRAEAARMLAEEMKDDAAKATMLRIAENYDSLTAHAILTAKTAHSKSSEQPYVDLNPNVTVLQTAR